ncbi:SDR family NAD(P)-dependent oxidoreductase [Streptomyces sp. NPDC096057]|uniref:SDR family NAD(P)-dependent oxidoreductase n=1 Tax=Streptomyces sp. NPDC096057 TaxID=3155543 RepID=UPI00333402E9
MPERAATQEAKEQDVAGRGERVAVVTGGAGGIGRLLARRLVELGYRVVVADANEAGVQKVAVELSSLGKGEHHWFAGDLTGTDANRRLAEQAASYGPLTVLVNAVGISPKGDNGRKKPFYDLSEEEWDLTMAVNLKAPFLLVKEAFRYMPTDGSASVVNLLSITSKLGTGGLPGADFPPYLPSSVAYAASKGALQNLTASLSRELAGFRIRVNGVAPGFVATPMMAAVQGEDFHRMARQVPMGRFAGPHEVADAIEFLISDKASYVNGTSLDVNGGWLTC